MLVLLIFIVIAVFLLFKLFSATVGIIGIVIGLILAPIIIMSKVQEHKRLTTPNRPDKTRRTPLHKLPEQIDEHLGAIQTATNEADLNKHMEKLLAAMDELSAQNERILEASGLTKSTIPQQREYAYRCYDSALARIKKGEA